MRIEKIETFLVPPRSAIVRLRTDEGTTGFGEVTVEGHARAQCALVREISRVLVGADPLRPEAIFQRMVMGHFYRDGYHFWSVVSGIDQACWDILGKSLGVPVYTLFGGPVRERIRVYRGVGGETLEEKRENARTLKAEGWTALKMGCDLYGHTMEGMKAVREATRPVRAVREVLGDEADLMVDFHGKFAPSVASRLCHEMDDLGLLFIEEPCYPELLDEAARIARALKTPVALGERVCARYGFRKVLEKGAFSVIQPDPSHAGGLAEVRKIAAMAEAFGVALAPHNPLSAINLAVAIQIGAICPNWVIQEMRDAGEGLLKDPFRVQGGCISIPTKPGLGIEVNEEWLESAEWQDWQNPIGRLDDGSVAPW